MPRVNINVGGRKEYTEDLKKRLKKYGISQNRLAKQMGVAPSVLSRWFNSDIDPSMSSVTRIESALVELVRNQSKRRKVARANGA